MIKFKNISLILENMGRESLPLFTNLNFSLPAEGFTWVIGGNGSGKSSLFNLISGHLLPTSGKILIQDQDVTQIPQHARAAMISKVVQDPKVGTVAELTIAENMALALTRGQLRGLGSALTTERRSRFQEALKPLNMGLEDRLDHVAGALSGGQRQALSLVMALLSPSQILLMDEITAALDEATGEKVLELAYTLSRKHKKTTLMITHEKDHLTRYPEPIMYIGNGTVEMK